MKEENKYYQPTIEEFHVGFEYEYGIRSMYKNDIHDTEIKERLIWSKEKLDIDDFLGDSVSDIGNRI